ncbi:MAG: molybdopterin-dependent oxidoreductase [Coriobacteriales bacterium]|jgi:molybdopterin-containing oxidoreductase family molybdopterin binding subunit|nr:molybdopterin-dependent oxidoreductase [Coriobacteriales bacterium]
MKETQSGEVRVKTPCQGWGCHEQCILETVVVDGKIVRTERSLLAGANIDDSRICQKGIVSGNLPFLEKRLTKPLKRVGKRGEGKFEEISWDQAFDEIGAKMNEAREKYGPLSVIINPFVCGYPGQINALAMFLEYRFANLFGSSVLIAQAADIGTIHTELFDYSDPLGASTDTKNMNYSNHILIWGGNPIGFTRAACTSKVFMDAQERGVKITDIGLIFDNTAAKADQFVPINPGTDAQLALSMVNYMIENDLVDYDFIGRRTVAPFLVRQDNGKFLRESDIEEDGTCCYVYWDTTGKLGTVAPRSEELNGAPDFLAEVTINGIACKTAFLMLKERVSNYTFESQAKITGVSPEVAKQVVTEYCTNQPATLFMYYGLRYKNAVHTYRCIDLIAILSGNMKYRGGQPIFGGSTPGHPVQLGEGGIMFPRGVTGFEAELVHMSTILDSFENPDQQQYKVFYNAMGNPVQNWPNHQLWAEKVFPHMDLIVDVDIRITDTSRYADYVLPEATVFERHEIIGANHDCVVLCEPAIEPVGDTLVPSAVWAGIAERVGLGEQFPADEMYWMEQRLLFGDPAFSNVTPPITLERLQKEKVIRLDVPEEPWDPYFDVEFHPSASGRIEFYREEVASSGGAMALWMEPQLDTQDKEKYPLQFFPGRHKYYMQGQFTEFPELRVLGGKVSTVAMNPKTAHEYGLKQGDWVEVYNDLGNAEAILLLSEQFPPGMAHLWYSYPTPDYPTDPPTALSSEQNTDTTMDPILVEYQLWREQNKRDTGTPNVIDFFIQRSPELFWDDRCNVRKKQEG